ncbi:uncharacterized protein LOC26535167 isoform X1 [Drosophila yakuba]|uniref:Uncharacterized protein, isoform B n=1 Tax=Drosophila yakuba TaxID=7245 RepID=A0A0R1EIW4_DROYA|nr:uncharacterized protein LOC26535167 isoform X1 [Drosophila yakuba]KRK07090.1 uncharacterized protein Dyak_GE27986, isoform B [Drosophila yakuba]
MTVKLHFFVAFLTFSTYYLTEVYSLVEFTNVQCESVDKDYTLFPYCYLKSVNRSYKYVSVKAKLLQLPVAKAKVRLALYKRLNGYKPFLYDMTIDACRFLKYPKSNPVALYFYNCFKEYSNLNHTCPFEHDIVLDKMSYHSINNKLTKVLPFPEGNYMFEMHWMAYDINRAITKFYFSLS